MGKILLSRASLRFPTNRDPDADLASGTNPSWILLDFSAFVLDRRNSTTATCKFMGDKDLQVTFVVAHPPNVSYFCVHCRGLKLSDYAMEPQIVATEADLALLRIVVGGASCSPDYFIYRAGEGEKPSLEHLPRPRPYLLGGDPLGILKYDTGYVIVSLGDDTSSAYRGVSLGQFEVCLFDSNDKIWKTKPVDLPRTGHFDHDTSKVIIIGGKRGTVAFVDLWRGILLYDVLAMDPLLRYIPLPDTICSKKEYSVNPMFFRDIAVVKGNIRYVEMGFKVMTHTGLTGPLVATYSMPATCRPEDTWEHHYMIDASKIHDDKNILSPELLRMSADDKEMDLEPTIENLRIVNPTLCFHDEDIVYFLTKFQPKSKKACVVAVSMTNGSIEAVARFGAERTYGTNFSFLKSRISSYLNAAPGT